MCLPISVFWNQWTGCWTSPLYMQEIPWQKCLCFDSRKFRGFWTETQALLHTSRVVGGFASFFIYSIEILVLSLQEIIKYRGKLRGNVFNFKLFFLVVLNVKSNSSSCIPCDSPYFYEIPFSSSLRLSGDYLIFYESSELGLLLLA